MARELNFPKAFVSIDDWDVRTPLGLYSLADILNADVVTKRDPIDWQTFREVYITLFLIFAAIWAASSALGWNGLSGPALAVFWLALTIYAARVTVRNSYRYCLILETRSGPIDATTSNDEKSVRLACDAINDQIKRNASTPRPPQSGEPTRWMQAN
jgi:uncharacterized protein DUF6232